MSIIQNRITKFIFPLICISIGLMTAPSGSAQEAAKLKVVEVLGSGAVAGDKVASARKQAISGGLVSAVAMASLDLLPLDTQVKNFKILNRVLFNQVDALVQDYKVLTEHVTAGQYRVVVRVSVKMNRVKEHLSSAGLITSRRVMPKILFFTAEQKLGARLPQYWWGDDLVVVVPSSETAMTEILKKKKFTIVPHGNIAEPLNRDLNLSVKEATAIGQHLTADIVVIGFSKVQIASNVMGNKIKSYKGSVVARAYRTDTGEEIASVSRTEVAAGEDAAVTGRKALFNAGALAGEELSKQIISARQKAASVVPSVKIVVIGTGDLKNFIQFRTILGSITGVSEINIKEIKPNESTIMVDYSGTGDSLAEALMLKTYESFGIDIYEVSPKSLGIELIPE